MSYTDQEKAAIIAQYKQGISVQKLSTKYVAKLMREMGLSSIRTTAKQDYLKLHEPEKKKNSTQLITSTFKMAWKQRTPEAKLIFHITRFALQVCTICVLQVTSSKNKQKA